MLASHNQSAVHTNTTDDPGRTPARLEAQLACASTTVDLGGDSLSRRRRMAKCTQLGVPSELLRGTKRWCTRECSTSRAAGRRDREPNSTSMSARTSSQRCPVRKG